MIKISVEFNTKPILAKLFELRKDVIEKGTVSALNKVAKQVKTAASKEIRAVGYKWKAAAIKDAIQIDRATSGNPVVIIRCTGMPIPLIQFEAIETPDGVTVNVKNGRKLIRHAFIATMSSGHRGVFVRRGNLHKKNKKGVWSGLPIDQLFGPGFPKAFGNEVVQAALIRLVRERFPAILEHEIKFYGR